MLGNLGLGKLQPVDEVSHRPRAISQQFNDLKAAGLCERFEGGHHGKREYASKRIFVSRNILRERYTIAPIERNSFAFALVLRRGLGRSRTLWRWLWCGRNARC